MAIGDCCCLLLPAAIGDDGSSQDAGESHVHVDALRIAYPLLATTGAPRTPENRTCTWTHSESPPPTIGDDGSSQDAGESHVHVDALRIATTHCWRRRELPGCLRIAYPLSSIVYQVSSIKYQVSSIEYRVSSIK